MTTRRAWAASSRRLGAERVSVCAESASFLGLLAPTRRYPGARCAGSAVECAPWTPALPEGLTSRPLAMDDAYAVYEVMARQEQHDLGKVEIEPADIVGDWQKPSFDVGGLDRGRPRRRRPWSPMPRSTGRAGATRPSTRRTATAGSVRRSPPGCATRTAELGRDRDRLARSPRARPATTSSRSSAGTSAGPAGCCTSPRAPRIPDRPLPDGYADPVGHAGGLPGRPRRSRRTPSSSGPSASASRSRTSWPPSVRRPGLRAVALPGGDRRRRARSSASALMSLYGEPPVEAFISQLAVRRDQRHRGLAQALLVDAFARGREHGAQPRGPLHRLPHRRADPLPEGRHGGHRRLGEPRHRGVSLSPLSASGGDGPGGGGRSGGRRRGRPAARPGSTAGG